MLEKSPEEVLETGITLEIICMFVLYFSVSTFSPCLKLVSGFEEIGVYRLTT